MNIFERKAWNWSFPPAGLQSSGEGEQRFRIVIKVRSSPKEATANLSLCNWKNCGCLGRALEDLENKPEVLSLWLCHGADPHCLMKWEA